MAAPSYTEDLTDITLAQSTTDYSAYGGGGAGLGTGADFAMQGTLCVDKQITNADKGILYDEGTGITLGTGDHIFQWLFNATPGLADTLENNGASIGIGTGTNAFCKYHVEGSDTYGAQGRVGKCYPVDYTNRTTNATPPYRTAVGSPGATPDHFGGGLNTTATVKGANLGIDACRYGTGAYITAGDSGDPATFDGFATQNDAIANRWGILTDIGGSYELQGTFAIGQNNAGTATLAYFEDSDVNIVLADTIHSAIDFTKFVMDHASTEVYWTNVSVTALGTHNPGELSVLNASTVFELTGGVFTGFGTTDLEAACVVVGTTWRSSGQVTGNGASITGATFDNSTAAIALAVDDLDDIDTCVFNSSGTGHAIDLGTISASQTRDWDHTLTGYAAQGGTAANRAILVNVASGQTLTINVTAGATEPTYYNTGTGTVSVLTAQITIAVTVLDDDTGLPIGTNCRVLLYDTDDYTTEILNSACNASGVASASQGYSADIPVEGWCREMSVSGTDYIPADISGTVTSTGFALTVRLKPLN